ncbi:MAG: hypothetical protein IKN83_06180 [Bacteroidaceae bacterium]|nr:hypothetical protein [Bacteroidaceae bacterium]
MNYDDIINHPHHVSTRHPQMSMQNRAAQFAPFAALTGYHAAIDEAARPTQQKPELEEYDNERLNHVLSLLMERNDELPTLSISYFQADARKEGGSFEHISAPLKRIDEVNHQLIFCNGMAIPLADIIDIEEERGE